MLCILPKKVSKKKQRIQKTAPVEEVDEPDENNIIETLMTTIGIRRLSYQMCIIMMSWLAKAVSSLNMRY